MTPEDYASIGLKCGLEVHQQLLTQRKLFCRCPAGRYSDAYDAEVLRHMRPTLSELGEYDGTALMEKKTRKNIYYRMHHDTVCTYESDDTPPFFPDPVAIDIALEISMLLGLNIVGEMHIARKQYLDGSIPTGFQRTAILGVGGSIPFKGRRIGITQLSMEEDSCREVADVGHDRILLTDRLGMPLIEVVTDPDMRTPQEMAEVCEVIRLLCRSTGKVRTGYGAGREDVNVSVRGGTRIEIKGVPQISRIPLLVYNEAMRQCSLLGIRDELRGKGITADSFACTTENVSRAVSRTTFAPIQTALSQGHQVYCVVLRGFAGILSRQTQEHTTFAKEFSDRVRVIACLTDLPNLVHSDTASDLLSVRDWKELRRRTRATDDDALILVWGSELDCRTACDEIVIRAREATIGVPSDTRQALKDGTNGFERVLPGAERMYPDTDLPPMRIEAARLSGIRGQLPEPVWNRLDRFRALGLPEDTLEDLSIGRRGRLFDRLVDQVGVDPVFAAVVLSQRFKAWRRAHLPVDAIPDESLVEVFRLFCEGRLTRDGVVSILEEALRGGIGSHDLGVAIQEACRAICDGAPDAEIDHHIAEQLALIDRKEPLEPEKKKRLLIGRVVKVLGGRADGKRIAERAGRIASKAPATGVPG